MAQSDSVQQELVSTWQRAGHARAEIRRQEVARLTDAQALAAAEDLLSAMDRLPPRPLRPSSGLVEQQRLLHAGTS